MIGHNAKQKVDFIDLIRDSINRRLDVGMFTKLPAIKSTSKNYLEYCVQVITNDQDEEIVASFYGDDEKTCNFHADCFIQAMNSLE